MSRYDWHGLAALVLSLSVAVSLVVIASAKLVYDGAAFTGEEVGLFSTVLGAAVGALATYLGSGVAHHDEPSIEEEPEEISHDHEEHGEL